MIRKLMVGLLMVLTVSIFMPISASANEGYIPCGGGEFYHWKAPKNRLLIHYPRRWIGGTGDKYVRATQHAASRLERDTHWTAHAAWEVPPEQADVIVESYYDANDSAVARAGPLRVTGSNGCYITKSIIRFNSRYRTSYDQGTLNAVTVHELGHALGLAHTKDPTPFSLCDYPSIMQGSVSSFWNYSCRWGWYQAIDRWHINMITPPGATNHMTQAEDEDRPAPPHVVMP